MLNCLLLKNTISKESRTLILSSLTLAIGVISQGSYAEDLTQEEYLEVSAPIATKSAQATNDKNALQLDTIVVTARRRVEEAQKSSRSHYGASKANTLKKQGFIKIQDLQQQFA